MTIILDINGNRLVHPARKRDRVEPIDPESKDNKYKNNKEHNREQHNKHKPSRLVDRYV